MGGYGDVEIVVGETGWSSQGEVFEPKCTVPNAVSYNRGLVQKYNSGQGTPLLPRKKFETYIFALFNENKKTGSMAERNFGLFRPDFSAVYDIGIMRGGAATAKPVPRPALPAPAAPKPKPAQGGKKMVCAESISHRCSITSQYRLYLQPRFRLQANSTRWWLLQSQHSQGSCILYHECFLSKRRT